jgi:hypothetical protein
MIMVRYIFYYYFLTRMSLRVLTFFSFFYSMDLHVPIFFLFNNYASGMDI